MLKFVHSDASLLSQKRKQTRRACEKCRNQKKRCTHSGNLRVNGSPASHPTEQNFQRHQRRTAEAFKSPSVETPAVYAGVGSRGSKRTNGLQNPAAEVEASQNPEICMDSQCPVDVINSSALDHQEETIDGVAHETEHLGSRFIGDLNPESIFLAAENTSNTTGADQPGSVGIWLVDKVVKRGYCEPTSLHDQPESSMFYGFSTKVHKVLLPLLAEECMLPVPPQPEFEALYSIYLSKIHDIFPVLDEASFRNLDPAEPASILLKQGICLLASMNIDAKRHLRLQNTASAVSPGEFGRRLSAAMRMSIEIGLVKKKIIIIQALALLSFFMEGPNGGDISSQVCGQAVHYVHSVGLHVETQRRSGGNNYAETLMCCIWALDRMNAAHHGRPVLMHDRDMGRDLESCIKRQKSCFQLFLRVCLLLDRVINLYRPRTNQTADWEGEFPSYEEIILKSGEAQISTPLLATIEIFYYAVAILSYRSKILEEPRRSDTSYVRQSLSALQITSIFDQDFREHLSHFPFVPYAVSLSLSVAYRELRHTKVPMYRSRARSKLVKNCNILQSMGEYFWSASAMAEMGQLTLREMDRIYSEMASLRLRKSGPFSTVETRNTLGGVEEQVMPPISVRDSDTEWPSYDENENGDLDQYLPSDIADLDVFALFDPSIDLSGIDECLGGNLNLSFPTFFE